MDSYTRQLNAERLKLLCDRRDRAAAAVQDELKRQGKTRPRVTLDRARAEIQKIRDRYEIEQQTNIALRRVQEGWTDPTPCWSPYPS